MSTPAQIEANQANAQLSTGPRTPEGKANSAANSTKLGLYAKQAVLLTAEDQQEFATLTAAYEYELRPYTPVERTIFAQLVLAAWNVQRANRLEAALAITEGVDPLLSENKTFQRIAAARVRAERTFNKSLKELRATPATGTQQKSTTKNEPRYMSISNGPNLRTIPKTGRNEPCPCKSGRKFKQCCLQNEANPAATVQPVTINDLVGSRAAITT